MATSTASTATNTVQTSSAEHAAASEVAGTAANAGLSAAAANAADQQNIYHGLQKPAAHQPKPDRQKNKGVVRPLKKKAAVLVDDAEKMYDDWEVVPAENNTSKLRRKE